MKRCCRCKKAKPVADYYRNRSCKDGLAPECKLCCRARLQRMRDEEPERVRGYRQRTSLKHHDAKLARDRAWYAANKSAVSARDKGKRRARSAQQVEKERLMRAEYFLAHQEESRQRARRWRAKNRARDRELKRAYKDRKRAATARALASLTPAQWEAILALYENRCAYCGVAGVRLEREHVKPLSRGGDTSAENIVPACRSCNAKKHAKTPAEWLGLPRPN